jgi:hypothetical protein
MKIIKKIQKYRDEAYLGRVITYHPVHVKVAKSTESETLKRPYRFEIINTILDFVNKENANYLEIGVRNPDDNYNKILAKNKYSVDPGIEFKENPVDFKATSDEFFDGLKKGKYLNKEAKFDVIFIDGLHTAEQVKRDIDNALQFLSEDGFVVLHDCNPPTEYHAREDYSYDMSPAKMYWNGTTWKAFVDFRKRDDYYSCCIDADWGIGVIHKKIKLGSSNNVENSFYEYKIFEDKRKESLNILSYSEFKEILDASF